MTKTPASEPHRPDEPDPASASRPPSPKRGAFPTPRSEIEAAEPYVPEPYVPEPDDPEPDDVEPDAPEPEDGSPPS